MNIIETNNLTKYYKTGKGTSEGKGDVRIRGIDRLNLAVPEGEIYGFIGPNGAGKSTTIRTLLGLIRPDSGRGSVLGKDIARDLMEILADTGYMPSEAAFYPGMRVKEVLRLSADLRRRGGKNLTVRDCRQEADRLCERLQLDPYKKIEELSLGNKKKTSIICALLHKPKLYILDEPTSGLDPLIQKEFFTILKERQKEGATIFLSSHVLSEIQRHCSRAAIIRDGRIIVEGKMEDLASTQARRVTVHGITDMGNTLTSGMRDIRRGDHFVSFLYQGEMPVLLSALAALPVSDLTVTEPDLEEIFLHYYG